MNTMETYRKINQWTSHSRDMVESFKRYYNNSFLDGQRQEAYNLFLGNYIFAQGQPMLWDLSTDYYLHHRDPRTWSAKGRKIYIHWFTPSHLVERRMPPVLNLRGRSGEKLINCIDDYWLEYYRPLALSSFLKIFSFRMNSTLRYIPFKSTQEGRYDLSPFHVRTSHDQDSPEKSRSRKGVKILEPLDTTGGKNTLEASHLPTDTAEKEHSQPHDTQPSILKETQSKIGSAPKTLQDGPTTAYPYKDKSAMTQWTLNQFAHNSLNPSVASTEMEEYGQYVSHPLNLPLVVSKNDPTPPMLEFLSYVQSISADSLLKMHAPEEDIADYTAFLDVGDDPLTVTDADTPKKRYKAYGQWLKGKSLFKQSRLDP